MTEDEIEKLAERIADLVMIGLIEKQKEWDQQFTTDVNQMFGAGYNVMQDEEQLLLAELARLMTLLSQYEETEQYEKAAIVQNKIQRIQNKLSKQPMLAYKVGKKEVDWSEKVFMQPKLDGVRCVISKDGAYSRTGKEWLNIHHITTNLEPFFEKYPEVVLDGELYNHELKDDFEKIISQK
jgi:ATP-dependent DNA ligase